MASSHYSNNGDQKWLTRALQSDAPTLCFPQMKNLVLTDQHDVTEYLETIRDSAYEAQMRVAEIAENFDAMIFLERVKFESVGCDPLDPGRALNFIEQINQTFTYLASFRAAEFIFETHQNTEGLVLNLGTARGFDIESKRKGVLAAEVFAATRPGSNDKLRKDVKKVGVADAMYKYVFFLCPGIEAGLYKGKGNPEVRIWSLGM